MTESLQNRINSIKILIRIGFCYNDRGRVWFPLLSDPFWSLLCDILQKILEKDRNRER